MASYTICVAETHDGAKWVPATVPDQLRGYDDPGEIQITNIRCHVPRYALGLWGHKALQPDDLAPSTAESSLGLDYIVLTREAYNALVPDFGADEYSDLPDAPRRWHLFRRDVERGLSMVDASTRCRLIFWVD